MPLDLTAVLLVADKDKYARYRAKIAPLLEATGGAFRYDFEISRTLLIVTPFVSPRASSYSASDRMT